MFQISLNHKFEHFGHVQNVYEQCLVHRSVIFVCNRLEKGSKLDYMIVAMIVASPSLYCRCL